MKVIKTKTIAKYNRGALPEWLAKKGDAELDKYFMEHPTSKYNPFTQFDPEDDEPPKKRRKKKEEIEEDDDEEKEEEPQVDEGKDDLLEDIEIDNEEAEQEKAKEERKEEKREERKAKEEESAQESDDGWTEHKLPLFKRLTFNGWSKSAPTKEVEEKLKTYREVKEDLDLDRIDLLDKVAMLKEQQAEDKDLRRETESPRRKKRLEKRISRRGEKISKIREKLLRIKNRTSTLRKRTKQLSKELQNRGQNPTLAA